MTTVVTSFSDSYYEDIGKYFLSSFVKYWPSHIDLFCYVETNDFEKFIQMPNIKYINLYNSSVLCYDFLERHIKNSYVKGTKKHPFHLWHGKQKLIGYNYKYDAYRFSRKVFALNHFCGLNYDHRLIWLDADVLTKKEVPGDIFELMLPKGKAFGFLRREYQHSECGLMCFDLKNQNSIRLLSDMQEMYSSDEFLKLPEWHDSYVFDYCRTRFDGEIQHYLNVAPVEDVFSGSVLGEYCTHYKGPRKGDIRADAINLEVCDGSGGV